MVQRAQMAGIFMGTQRTRKRAPLCRAPSAFQLSSPGDHFLPFFAPFFMGLYRHELPLQPPS
jgi:hypothetical protein